MTFGDTVAASVQNVINAVWNIRDGEVVPKTEDVTLSNGAVKLDATYVYADMADSSKAAQVLTKEATGKIIRCYLDAASRILRHYGGEIRSFDGDRVMAIFIGTSKNTNAVKAALGINWAVQEVVKPKLATYWPTLKDHWKFGHGVGIATGEALIVRGGVRDNNDLVSIGSSPNVAAKLSEIRGTPNTFITTAVYDQTHESAKVHDGQQIWQSWPAQRIGGNSFRVLASTWWWKP